MTVNPPFTAWLMVRFFEDPSMQVCRGTKEMMRALIITLPAY